MTTRISNIDHHLVKVKGKNFMVGWRHNGEYFRFSTRTKKKGEAEQNAEIIFKQWAKNCPDFTPLRSDSFDVEMERYLRTAKKHITDDSKNLIRRTLGKLKRGLDLKSVPEFTREAIEENQDKVRGEANAKYWCNIMGDIRSFVKWCIQESLIPNDPTVRIVLPKQEEFFFKGEEAIWLDDEFELVCKTVSKADSIYLKVLRYTGMDVSDMSQLEKKHILKDSKGLVISKLRQKSKVKFNVPIDDRVLPIFESVLKRKSGRLFSEETFKSFTTNLGDRIRYHRRTLKLPERGLKDLRHTFITEWVEEDVPFDVIRVWIGHKRTSRILELRYAHRRNAREYMR